MVGAVVGRLDVCKWLEIARISARLAFHKPKEEQLEAGEALLWKGRRGEEKGRRLGEPVKKRRANRKPRCLHPKKLDRGRSKKNMRGQAAVRAHGGVSRQSKQQERPTPVNAAWTPAVEALAGEPLSCGRRSVRCARNAPSACRRRQNPRQNGRPDTERTRGNHVFWRCFQAPLVMQLPEQACKSKSIASKVAGITT